MIDQIRAHIEAASGRKPADVVLKNGLFLDLFTEELVAGDLAVQGGKIAALGSFQGRTEIDLEGKIVVPGLIDAHVHIESSFLSPPAFAALTVPRGTTTIVADPHEIANVQGIPGIRWMLESSEHVPQSVFFMLPSCVPATSFEDAGAVLKAEDLEALIGHPRVLGLGEVMDYPAVAAGEEGILAKIAMARKAGKRVDGHSPGVHGTELKAYGASGVGTDHECSTLEEMKQRLRLGMYILIRQGTVCQDLANLIPGVTEGIARRCAFCTDDKLPGDIIENGHIDNNVRLAIQEGLTPLEAVRMATLNAAEAHGLTDRGALVPGRLADLLVLEGSLEEFQPYRVFRAGKEVAAGGKLLTPPPAADNKAVLNTVNMAPLTAGDLALKIPSGRGRAITVSPGSVLTGEAVLDVPIDKEGFFVPSPDKDVLKLAVIERHKARGRVGLGLVSRYGLKGGAVSSSIAHDSHNLIVIGDDDEAMLAAVQAIVAAGGGVAATRRGGEVLGTLPLPLGGLMTPDSGEETAARLEALTALSRKHLGIPAGLDPFMLLSFLGLPVIPQLKLTTRGLFDVTKFEFVPVGME